MFSIAGDGVNLKKIVAHLKCNRHKARPLHWDFLLMVSVSKRFAGCTSNAAPRLLHKLAWATWTTMNKTKLKWAQIFYWTQSVVQHQLLFKQLTLETANSWLVYFTVTVFNIKVHCLSQFSEEYLGGNVEKNTYNAYEKYKHWNLFATEKASVYKIRAYAYFPIFLFDSSSAYSQCFEKLS